MNFKKIILVLLAIAILGVVAFAIFKGGTIKKEQNGKPDVVVTSFVGYDFVKQVAGDKVNINYLLSPGVEMHSYQPSPSDIIDIEKSNIFIYTGGESEVWTEEVLKDINTDNIRTLKLMDTANLIKEVHADGAEEEEHEHSHEEVDPDNVKDRPLSDFAGSWISGIPLINNGSLNEYIEHSAEEAEEETAFDEMKNKLLQKWESEYNNISINGDEVEINGIKAKYDYKGFEVIENDNGVSVWYKYQIAETNNLPTYLIFNDHKDGNTHEEENAEEHEEIAHMHMKYGNENFTSLLENEKWSPFYFDNTYSNEEIGKFMAKHDEEHAFDEHVWTSPENAKKMVQSIANELAILDKENAEYYKENANKYIDEITALQNQIKEIVANKKRDRLVFADRMPMQYFLNEFGLTVSAAFNGCSTETEPSAATIAYLIDKVKEEKIAVVLYIELSSDKVAKTISEETGATPMQIQTLHNISKTDFNNNETYVTLMTRNLDVLKKALQ